MYTRSLLRSTRYIRPFQFSTAPLIRRPYHTTPFLNYYHNNNINDNEHNYTAAESDAEGIMTTDDLVPPVTSKSETVTVSDTGYDFDDELNQQYEWNEREPAAAASNSGGTLHEMKQFADNVVERTREALKGESRTSPHGTHSSESTQPPRRFVASYTKVKDQAAKAATDAKEAIKKAGKATGAEMSKNINQAEADAYAESSKANAQNVVENAKEAVSEAYQTAKQAVSKGTQEVKKKANEYANTASEKASEVADNIKRSAETMKETVTGASTAPRTDKPTNEPPIHSRTDGGVRPEPTAPRTDKTF